MAKAHLRVDVTDDDTYIDTLVKVARRYAETATRRALIDQTWTMKLDSFPASSDSPIWVPLPPLQSVSSVTYVDVDGNTQTWTSSKYTVDTDSEPGRIVPAYQEVYPDVRNVINAVTVTFVAGYGSAGSNVPEGILQGMLTLIAHMYENRQDVIVGGVVSRVPQTTDWLLWPYKALRF